MAIVSGMSGSLRKAALAGLSLLALAACSRSGEIDATGGIVAVRSACPTVGVPAHTGDITVFNPPQSTDSRAIDVVANITKLRSSCNESGPQLFTEATFEVQARRSDATEARDVVLPYFATVMRGGNAVVSKRVSKVRISFAPGAYRASATASASTYIDKDAATLPADIQERITRKRKAGDMDAALDPLADPQVRAAIARSSFELLIGFNLTQDQLKYNATR